MKTTIKSILICTLTSLLISRVLVLCHEVIGHGVPVVIVGGQIRGCILYFFGGGALVSSYKVPLLHSLFIASGGWLSQLLLAFIALTLLRNIKKNNALRFFLLAFSYFNIVHALFYMASSIYYGYGDGTNFYLYLPIFSSWLIVTASICMVISCYVLSWKLSENFIIRLACRKQYQILVMLGLALIVGIVQFTLYEIECRYLPNEVTKITSNPEHQKSPAEERTKPFPLNSLLITALFLSTLAGMARHTHITTAPRTPSWRNISVVFATLSLMLGFFAYIRIPIDKIPIVTAQSNAAEKNSP